MSQPSNLPLPPLPALDQLPSDPAEQRQYLYEAMYACSMAVRGLLILGAETIPLLSGPLTTPLQVVTGGLLVRCYKLYDSLLLLARPGHHETALILLRCLVDTVVNLAYISGSSSPEATAEAFIRSARAYDQERLADLRGRSSHVAPGEDRVLGSTLRHLACASLVPGKVSASDKRWSGEGGAKARAEAVGLLGAYRHSFAAGSHAVHGDWSDLYAFHLAEVDEGVLIPHMDYRGLQLALLEVASSLAIAALRVAALPGLPREGQEGFGSLLDWLDSWLEELDGAVVTPTRVQGFDPHGHQVNSSRAYLRSLVTRQAPTDDEGEGERLAAALQRKAAVEAAIAAWFDQLLDSTPPGAIVDR